MEDENGMAPYLHNGNNFLPPPPLPFLENATYNIFFEIILFTHLKSFI